MNEFDLTVRVVHTDTAIHSPFESILFVEQMKTILRDNRCSITPECHMKGKESPSKTPHSSHCVSSTVRVSSLTEATRSLLTVNERVINRY